MSNPTEHILTIDTDFAAKLPHFAMAMIEAKIVNSPYLPELQREIDRETARIALTDTPESIKKQVAVNGTRAAYRQLGKDPNRYRPAAEQLRRRIVARKGLYNINAAVDLGNLLSLISGYSVGLFHAPEVGKQVLLRIGREQDTFTGIGRGALNVANLPLYCDEKGPFANPTSDSERTKVRPNTANLLLFINSFVPPELDSKTLLSDAASMAIDLLKRFLNATDISLQYYLAQDSLLLPPEK